MLNIGRNLINFTQTAITSSTFNLQQVRTTYILKRRWGTALSKKEHQPRKLKVKEFVYELIEDTEVRKKPDLKVLLTSYVAGLGKRGDEVSVRPNFAYNKLLLPGLAVYPTPENKAKYLKGDDANAKGDELHSSPYAERTANVLSRLCCDVVMNKEQAWTLEPWHIRVSLRKAGIHVTDDSAITMPLKEIQGPNLDLENREFFVTITINNLEKVNVRCRIHHWSTKPADRLSHKVEPWCQPAEPVFEDQAQTLASIPLPTSKIPEKELPQLY